MNSFKLKVMDEDVFVEKLDNGLEIYMLPNLKVNKTYVTLTTKFGSINDEFIPYDGNEIVQVPSGIAHFLEHQMFEDKEGEDIVDLFEKNGAQINAMTDFHYTSYLFSATDNIDNNINLLLNLVYNFSITEASVEKEKGIIEQEINMYKDNPESELSDNVDQSLFINDRRKISIAGTVEDVYKTTKANLETCYKTFYHPSNMFMVLTGNFDPTNIVSVIKNNLKQKKFNPTKEIVLKEINEPKEVAIKYVEKTMNVENPKLAFSIKIPTKTFKNEYTNREIVSYISILLHNLFGSTSSLNEELKEAKLIDNELLFHTMSTNDYFISSIVCETNHKDEVIKKIREVITNISISDEEFTTLLRATVSSHIKSFENIRRLNEKVMQLILKYDSINQDMIADIKNLNIDKAKKLYNNLDLTNTSIVYIKNSK